MVYFLSYGLVGDMYACFHYNGSLPVVRDVLTIVDSGIQMQSANSFKTLG